MMLDNTNDLTHFLKQYIHLLFKHVDDEIAPYFQRLSFELLDSLIIIKYDNHSIGIPTSLDTIEQIFDKKIYLKDILHQHIFDYDITFFLSDFILENQKIYVYILGIDKKILDSYYRIGDFSGFKKKSILDSIIYETLIFVNQAIINFNNNREIISKSINDLLKEAGKSLLSSILNSEGIINPFDKLCKVSSLSYEKSFSNGKILLLEKDLILSIHNKPNINLLLTFEESIPLSSHRHIRKLLELSKKNIYLVSDGDYVYSVAEFDEALYNRTHEEHFFTVQFNSYYSWQLNHNGNKLMHVMHEEVFIPKPRISYLYFYSEFKKIYPDVDTKKIVNLYKLVLEASKQVKGTILVISKNARSEAYRLRNQGFVIESTYISNSTIMSITSIDGAVLLDVNGFCHGIGVILDGVATEKGDPSRGARYNSAIRYIETISTNEHYSDCVAIVISEDGDIDIISRLSI